jgi:hypothetical protein
MEVLPNFSQLWTKGEVWRKRYIELFDYENCGAIALRL